MTVRLFAGFVAILLAVLMTAIVIVAGLARDNLATWKIATALLVIGTSTWQAYRNLRHRPESALPTAEKSNAS